jgi:hypothetical protein
MRTPPTDQLPWKDMRAEPFVGDVRRHSRKQPNLSQRAACAPAVFCLLGTCAPCAERLPGVAVPAIKRSSTAGLGSQVGDIDCRQTRSQDGSCSACNESCAPSRSSSRIAPPQCRTSPRRAAPLTAAQAAPATRRRAHAGSRTRTPAPRGRPSSRAVDPWPRDRRAGARAQW